MDWGLFVILGTSPSLYAVQEDGKIKRVPHILKHPSFFSVNKRKIVRQTSHVTDCDSGRQTSECGAKGDKHEKGKYRKESVKRDPDMKSLRRNSSFHPITGWDGELTDWGGGHLKFTIYYRD